MLLSALQVFANPIAIPMPTEQAIEYHSVSNIAWGINQLLGLLLLPIALLILESRTQVSTKLKFGKYLTVIIFAASFFILNRLIQLPLDRIRTNNLNQIKNDAGLPILQWIFSQVLHPLPSILFSILVALFVYWLINKSLGKWWLWATGIFSFLILVFLVVEPYTISHNPLGQTPLEAKMIALS